MIAAPPSVHRLANGVEAICDPAAGFSTMALSIVAGRGSRWEDEERGGWSHLLEHMVFKGAGERSAKAIVAAIEDSGGQINAVTSWERTSFQVRGLTSGLEVALAVVADLLLDPRLDGAELEKEKRIVGQEIAEAADIPDDQVFELAFAAAFPGQPIGRPVLGSRDAIGRASPQGLARWREALYAPDRVVASVAGPVEEEAFLALVEAHFGGARCGAPAPAPPLASFEGGIRAETRRLEQAHLVFALPAGGVGDPDRYALRLFGEMLGGSMSSRLFQRAREEMGLAYAIDAFAEGFSDVGLLGVYAGCAGKDAARLAAIVATEIRDLAEGPDPSELARAKAQLSASLLMSAESLPGRAEQWAWRRLALGRLETSKEIAAEIAEVAEDDIRRAAARLLGPGRFAAAMVGPASARRAGEAFGEALFG
ncbi:MAG: M16 family metallopeptidase [Caulobacteraceae bacterium]